jgi:hypothetical protein
MGLLFFKMFGLLLNYIHTEAFSIIVMSEQLLSHKINDRSK